MRFSCMSSPRDGEPEPADPPSPEFRSRELAPLPAVAGTPADQLGRHRGQDEDDADNPWASLFRPVALQFDGDEADEVPHTPAQEEFPAALAANLFDGIFIGTPPREDPADECAICQETIGEHDGWRWPMCHVAHRFHAVCVARHRPVSEALAHLNRTGDMSRLSAATCPLCRRHWPESAAEGEAFTALLAHLGFPLPEDWEPIQGLPSCGCRPGGFRC